MTYSLKYLLLVISILFILVFLVFVYYFKKYDGASPFEQRLDQDVHDFCNQLGIDYHDNYFIADSYIHPFLNLFIVQPIFQIFMTRVVLVIVTPDALFMRVIGNQITFANDKRRNLEEKLIRIPKSAIQQFDIQKWEKRFIVGYLVTVRTEGKSYYFHISENQLQGFNSSSRNFIKLKENHFLGLLTDKN
ncbi:hypothetical protein STRDD10_01071 [Streptococcus sp. DD10]|uniref:hypothetical protein n=1 Tax=Streptococcus sp. DD10 TaxID=1777878 RepID=UPI00079AF4DD|nr:hypothetical protein [Streptococcus sp. DD10]KXT74254.1 hypothetical protein STRDD10_01071 [Streptococcus sp. DD10]